jgi:glycosyltransferase involved in cell wall biosynthesis
MSRVISVVGIRGLPAKYGGFETFADFFCRNSSFENIVVYCDPTTPRDTKYNYADRIFLPLSANGIQGIFFDIICILIASIRRHDILVLGCSGALAIPFARMLGIRVVTNIAGLEWGRSKWGPFARLSLRLFEWIAVKSSSYIVADNRKLKQYVKDVYGVNAKFIPYGGNQVAEIQEVEHSLFEERNYYLSVARCQPDNNLEMIIDACVEAQVKLILISDFNSNTYGKKIRKKISKFDNIIALEAIYNLNILGTIRKRALAYIHGHSAGGTNPVLVESMWQKKACICFDNGFNNSTTNELGLYFKSSGELKKIIIDNKSSSEKYEKMGNDLYTFATKEYCWEAIINSYDRLYD